MQLSPTVRWLLAGLVGAATAAVSILADGFQPLDVLLIFVALGGALGLVPPQVGGTQQGVVNPSMTEPPRVDVHRPRIDQTGFSEGHLSLVPLAFLFAAERVSEGEALFWIGILVVVGCLVAAAVAAFRYAQYVGAAVLVVIAIVAAVLLL